MYQNNAHSLPGPEPVKYVSQPAPTATFIPVNIQIEWRLTSHSLDFYLSIINSKFLQIIEKGIFLNIKQNKK